MRRRERLTGFFIIFILLTFSAYSNSMNIGGRIGIAENQQNTVAGDSSQQKTGQDTKNIAKITNRNETKTTTINNSTPQNNSQMSTGLDLRKENNSSAADRTINTGQIDNNLNQNRNKNQTITSPRDENSEAQKDKNISQADQEKTFTPKPEPHLPHLIDQIKVHKVRSGETLWDIAHKHDLNIDSLIGANNISNMNSIKPGQEFKILPVKGIVYRVSPGESLGSIASKFDLKAETIMKDNNIEDGSTLKVDQKLILRGAKPEFSYQDRLDQKFMYPINTRITSYYGPRWGRIHEGLDFAAPMGSPIRAVSSGRVVFSGWSGGYGYVVIIQHQKGLRTLYAHNSKLLVSVGESVGRGEVISRSGNTGNSTGPHLHFEVQVNGRPENPLDYIHK